MTTERIADLAWAPGDIEFDGAREFDEAQHPRDEAGKFTSGGGWSGEVEWHPLAAKAVPLERQQAVEKMFREEAGRWDEKTQNALRSMSLNYMTPEQTMRGVMAFTEPVGDGTAFVTIHPDIAGDNFTQYETARTNYMRSEGEVLQRQPFDGLATRGQETSARWVTNHEIAHVFLLAHASQQGPQQAKWLQQHGMNDAALDEMSRITAYASRSNFNEKFSEAAALYMTTGRVPGPNTAALLRATGIIKETAPNPPGAR